MNHPETPRWLAPFHWLARTGSMLVPESLLLLLARLSAASIFFLSGRTKVEGWLTISDSTFFLFENEYRLPLLPPEIAAYAATYAEHLLPVLLLIGLFTRSAALGLLGMTVVIQLFVYPDAWSTHLSWVAILLPLIAKGGGRATLDHVIRIP